jgi:hypothetical protein
MKRMMVGVLALSMLAGVRLANAQPSQLANDEKAAADARAAHERALKSGDKAAIARTEAQARAADANVFNDKKDAQTLAGPLPPGETRQSEQALIDAKAAHQHALASGNQAEIQRTAAALRTAYGRDYALRHPKHPG